MANLSTTFVGISSPNPFWLASAPPTDKEYNVIPVYKANWKVNEINGLPRQPPRQC